MTDTTDLLAVIVGAGHAGGRAAQALRAAGFAGPVVLLGDEPHPPYERPPLSKELLAGAIPIEKIYLKPASFYADAGIELRLGARAVELDRNAQRLVLEDGGTVPYDLLLLTTGTRARRLTIAGDHLPQVRYLRDIADSLALRERLSPDARLVVIGAGFIGLEVAAVARGLGCAVTVIEVAPHPLMRVAAPVIGDWFAAQHRERGVTLLTGVAVTEISERGRGVAVFTAEGDCIEADVVAVGIGAVPNAEIAEAAGLEVDNGIIVDEFGRTADRQVFAAGDVTRHYNPLLHRHLRLEAWQNAQNQAAAVAKVMAGGSEPHSEIPWYWTDQYGFNFQAAGAPLAWEDLVWRGSPAEGRFTVFYLHNGKPVAANAVNNARDIRFAKDMIARDAVVDPARLADPAVKLADLCRT
ncbi:MAG TPA: FAD-dependent oxidoreductase [Stellaceae bacterium]|jgi:NADPH-dependent 2,4-dienoyl-CoA reductase/sulfur reductase-like enzyme